MKRDAKLKQMAGLRAVVSQSGAVVQATDYSAYGVPSTRYKMMAE